MQLLVGTHNHPLEVVPTRPTNPIVDERGVLRRREQHENGVDELLRERSVPTRCRLELVIDVLPVVARACRLEREASCAVDVRFGFSPYCATFG